MISLSKRQELNFFKYWEQRFLERRQRAFAFSQLAYKHSSRANSELQHTWEKIQQLNKSSETERRLFNQGKPNRFKEVSDELQSTKAYHSSVRREYLSAKQRGNYYADEHRKLDIQYNKYRQKVEELLRELRSSP